MDEKLLESLVRQYQVLAGNPGTGAGAEHGEVARDLDALEVELARLILSYAAERLERIAGLPNGFDVNQAREEIVSDIGSKLRGILVRFRWKSPFLHYLHRVIRLRRISYLRRAIRSRGSELRNEQIADERQNQGKSLADRDLIERVRRIYIKKYPRNGWQDLEIIDFHLQEYDDKQIGAKLGLKQNTVAQRRKRTLEKLKGIILNDLGLDIRTLFS